ncbi:Peptidase S49 domain protein [Tolumonas auensis DSM 9187]|uniref:Peptidase S49 domain protein n=1 Tax=Tolumonas auensis (strain DSM 9187 / NBRC 110442 / TA 4) TaxID=595494 RepID=C4LEI0_TOLAT|nr:protease SohB [Tolumonas auensis]ACQ92997.1 Peptidase S49 domain protein [Tolumonas auensis DSM 9187]
MAFIYDYGLFAAKSITLVTVIALGVITIIAAIARNKMRKGALDITDLSADYQKNKKHLIESLLNKEQRKAFTKEQKKEAKEQKKNAAESTKSRLFLIDFKGGMDAREVSSLREEITAVLTMAKSDDEVLIRVESGGGVVHGYGLGASQLQRIRDQGLYLTVSIDKVAASGGYMMACVAQKIIAAPFAIVGSIGVVAQLPNFNRLLKKHDVDVELHTAGQFKRTLTIFGENDDKAREKFKAELETVHQQFKQFVSEHRPRMDMEQIATGEHWLAAEAKKLGLVDELRTSDDYLLSQFEQKQVIKVTYHNKKGLADRFSHAASLAVERAVYRIIETCKIPF